MNDTFNLKKNQSLVKSTKLEKAILYWVTSQKLTNEEYSQVLLFCKIIGTNYRMLLCKGKSYAESKFRIDGFIGA